MVDIMNQNLEIVESTDCISLKDVNTNQIMAKIYINEYVSKKDAMAFIKDIKKHIKVKQTNTMQEKMKKVDEEMQKCGYDLDRLKELYESTDDKFERQLIYAEIRSIEILNSIQIDARGE